MTKIDTPYLCGGVFVTQLLKCRKQRPSPRKRYLEGSDGLGNPKFLCGLIKVINPSFAYTDKDTFDSDTSSYINCKKNHGTNLQFKKDSSMLEDFNNQVKDNYYETLLRFVEFADYFLDVDTKKSSNKNAVKLLLQIIDLDKTISDNDEFYINADGSAVEKSVLVNMTEFNFYSFMLGVWHYAITKRFDNKSGKETLSWENIGGEKQITFNNSLPATKATIEEIKKEPQVEEPEVEDLSGNDVEIIEDRLDEDSTTFSQNNHKKVEPSKTTYIKNMFLGPVTYHDHSITNINGVEEGDDDE